MREATSIGRAADAARRTGDHDGAPRPASAGAQAAEGRAVGAVEDGGLGGRAGRPGSA